MYLILFQFTTIFFHDIIGQYLHELSPKDSSLVCNFLEKDLKYLHSKFFPFIRGLYQYDSRLIYFAYKIKFLRTCCIKTSIFFKKILFPIYKIFKTHVVLTHRKRTMRRPYVGTSILSIFIRSVLPNTRCAFVFYFISFQFISVFIIFFSCFVVVIFPHNILFDFSMCSEEFPF